MYNAYKFKLQPDTTQIQTLRGWVGCSRFIWNHMLTLNTERYAKEKKFIFKYDMVKLLPHKKDEFPFLKDVPAHVLLNRIFDLDTAMNRAFKKISGFPKYKSRHVEHHNTFKINQINGHIKPTKSHIKIPKMGWVNWIRHRPLTGKLKSITVKQENGFWWCICLCELPDPKVITSGTSDDVVGIDLGLKEFCIDDTGKINKTPKFYRKQQAKLRRAQQTLARRKKGSKNRATARTKLNKIHYKIKNSRIDFTHKISAEITKQYNFVAVEDLDIKGMMQHKHLAKSIADQGWAIFVNQLSYKCARTGGAMVKIDRYAASSKTCSNCNHVQNMPLSVRTYNCPSCNMDMDRDINAAINIKRWGIEEINRVGTTQIHACGNTP